LVVKHEDGTGYRCLAIGVRQPSVQRRHRGVKHEAEANQVGPDFRMMHVECIEGQAAGGAPAQEDAGQQDKSSCGVDQEVSKTGPLGLRAATVPDQEGGCKGHQFPEDEEGQKIGAIDNAQRAGNIEPARHVLPFLRDVQSIERTYDAHQGHDVAEDVAQAIHPPEGQSPVQEMYLAVSTQMTAHQVHVDEGQNGDQQQVEVPYRPRHEGEQQRTDRHDGGRMYPDIIYHNNPRGS